MDSDRDEAIYRPYLKIKYEEMNVAMITPTSTSSVSYTVEYFSDYSSALKGLLIGFIILNLIIFGRVGVRFYYFT